MNTDYNTPKSNIYKAAPEFIKQGFDPFGVKQLESESEDQQRPVGIYYMYDSIKDVYVLCNESGEALSCYGMIVTFPNGLDAKYETEPIERFKWLYSYCIDPADFVSDAEYVITATYKGIEYILTESYIQSLKEIPFRFNKEGLRDTLFLRNIPTNDIQVIVDYQGKVISHAPSGNNYVIYRVVDNDNINYHITRLENFNYDVDLRTEFGLSEDSFDYITLDEYDGTEWWNVDFGFKGSEYTAGLYTSESVYSKIKMNLADYSVGITPPQYKN